MSTNHPDVKDFEGFLRSSSRPGNTARNARVMRHLLAGCSICRERLAAMGWDNKRVERLLQVPGAESLEANQSMAHTYNYDKAFAQADRSLNAFLTVDKPEETSPADLWAEILSKPVDEQKRRVSREKGVATPQFAKHLIDLSHAMRYTDTEEMLQLADLARLAAESCSAETLGNEERLADLRLRAWGHFGNSLRVCGKSREAEEALATAEQYRKQGTGDLLLRARLFEQVASLRIFQGHFDQAISLNEEACRIYEEIGESHFLASSMIRKGIASLYAGEPENAVRPLNRAVPLIDCEEDPHLLLAACHNLIRCYIDLGRPEQALSVYTEAHTLYTEFDDPIILLRAGWQEGQLLRDLGHLHAAETTLLRVREGFLEKNLAYEVAAVSLDLAFVYVKLGMVEEVKQTVATTMPIFRALRVGREVLASLLQLQQVADQEHQALELIRALNARIQPLSRRMPVK
jgi:tetratricopeptide (TPR) repeat protein